MPVPQQVHHNEGHTTADNHQVSQRQIGDEDVADPPHLPPAPPHHRQQQPVARDTAEQHSDANSDENDVKRFVERRADELSLMQHDELAASVWLAACKPQLSTKQATWKQCCVLVKLLVIPTLVK